MHYRLKNTTCYLAGAIDHHEDPRAWRKKITSDVLHPLGIKVYDPLVKPSWLSEAAKVHPDNYKTALKGNHPTPKAIWDGMVEIRKIDLRFAHTCDFMICSLPKKFTVGTIEELTIAANAGKPVLIHAPDGVDVSTWLPNQLATSIEDYNENCIFDNWNKLYNYIRNVDMGMVEVDKFKWLFINYFNDPDVRKAYESPNFEQIRS
jgi:hypothetical protein